MKIRSHSILLILSIFITACGGGGGGGGSTPPPSYTVSTSASMGGSFNLTDQTVEDGDTTDFTITPEAGYDINNVSGCGGTLVGNTFTTGSITDNCTVTANFNIITLTVGTNAGAGGNIDPTNRTVNWGSSTTFTVTPDAGNVINTVSGCGGTLDGNTFTTGTITDNCTVSASFNIITLAVATNAGAGGSIDPTSRIIDWGTSTTFTVTPEAGYDINTVSGCGGTLNGNAYTTGTITGNCTVSASFNIITLTVGTNAGPGGSIDPTSRIIDWGTSTTFTVTPNASNVINTVSGCGGTLNGNTFTTGAITADCSITASFLPTYTVSTSAGLNGSISPASTIVALGASTSFAITPDAGFEINTADGCGGTLVDNTFTTGPITADCTITADFGLSLSADPLSKTITLSWDHSTASSYNVYYSTDKGFDPDNYAAATNGTMLTNVTSPHTISGLTNDTAYYFVLEAIEASPLRSPEVGARPGRLAINGAVNAIVTSGTDTTYLGGSFTRVGITTGNGIPLDRRSGKPAIANFPIVDGVVYASAPDGSGGWYIGGSFTQVGGLSRNRLAHILADGSVDPIWNPNANDAVLTLAVSGGRIYVGGLFTTLSGGTRNYLAAIRTNGTIDGTWAPTVDGGVFTLAVSGLSVYVGGNFTSVNGEPRNDLAAISTTRDASVTSWDPNVNSVVNSTVYSLAVSGNIVYVGGEFATVGGVPRSRLAAIATDGTLTAWDPSAQNTVRTLAVSGNTVYVAGLFSSVGGVARNGLAAIDADGTSTSWAPNVNYGVSTLAVSGNTVYLGGNFTSINGINRNRLAAITTDGTLTRWAPDINGSVSSLAVSDSAVYAGGHFTSMGGVSRNRLAAFAADGTLSDWNPDVGDGSVLSLAMSGTTIYVGGSFTTVGGVLRNYLAAIATDGSLTAWDPNANSIVRTLAVSGTTVYTGGGFTTMGGVTRNSVAAIDIDGTLTTWNPNITTGAVNTIAVSGTTVYVGGYFRDVGGVARNNLAAISTDGTLTAWDPDISGSRVSDYYNSVRTLTVSDNTVYVGGGFDSVGGVTRNGLAAISTSGLLTSWAPNIDGIVDTLAVSGTIVYVGGGNSFRSVNGVTRNQLAAITTSGSLTTWDPNAGFGYVHTLTVSGTTVYVGGQFSSIGGTSRSNFAAIGTDGVLQ